jgi:hypothetical protein
MDKQYQIPQWYWRSRSEKGKSTSFSSRSCGGDHGGGVFAIVSARAPVVCRQESQWHIPANKGKADDGSVISYLMSPQRQRAFIVLVLEAIVTALLMLSSKSSLIFVRWRSATGIFLAAVFVCCKRSRALEDLSECRA